MAYALTIEALADATRRRLFERMAQGPLSVGELAAGMPVSRPAVSQHLGVLKRARLVAERREGTRRLYRIDPRGLESLRAYLDQFWDEVLAAYAKAAAEEGKRKGEEKWQSRSTKHAARPPLRRSARR
jgi:DNA-binding transcriptional ArsR family regulator